MKTRAVRLYGVNDLRLEEFELPKIKDDEILARVVCDSLCMSSWKATHQADTHKRVPRDVAKNPVIIGHEFAGELVEVGSKWKSQFAAGDKFSIQPALNFEGGPVGVMSAPGYSYKYIGGDATYVIIPREVMELGCLLKYEGEGFYQASLSEPLSCVIGAMHANYHTTPGSYVHRMDIVESGRMAILAGVGPMGLALVNYVMCRERRPSLLVVTDIDQARLDRAAMLYSPEEARTKGVDLRYINTGTSGSGSSTVGSLGSASSGVGADPVAVLKSASGGEGYDDVFVFAPVAAVIEQADAILDLDGCLNFFAGPAGSDFRASLNFYNVHYSATHIAGTSGGNTDDMREALSLIGHGLDPAGLVTHIGGLEAVADTTMHLPEISGGKKLMYTHIEMPLTAIADFGKLGAAGDDLFAGLDAICGRHNGLWSVEAENYLLTTAKNHIK